MSNLEGANPASGKTVLTARSLKLTTKQPVRDPNPTTKATALTYLIFRAPQSRSGGPVSDGLRLALDVAAA